MAMAYIFCGEEEYLKQNQINELKKKILNPQTLTLNYETHQAANDDFILLKESLQSLSLLGQKLLHIKNADKLNTEQLTEILCLADKNKSAVIVLDSENKHFMQQVPASYKKIEVKVFEKVYANKIPAWLIQRAKQKGVVITTEAAWVLGENLGNNLALLDITLDALVSFVAEKKRIEKPDVEALVGANLSENVFELVDAVTNMDIAAALKLANRLLKSERESSRIINVIGWHFIRLLVAKEIAGKHKSPEAEEIIQKKLSLKKFFLDKFMRQVNNFSFSQIKTALRQLLAADTSIKTLSVNPKYILEVTLVKLCSR